MKKNRGFDTIVVNFTSGGRPHRVVIRPESRVRALFLNGSETEVVPTKTPRNADRPDSVEVMPALEADRPGPRGVCYLEDGVLKCWGRD